MSTTTELLLIKITDKWQHLIGVRDFCARDNKTRTTNITREGILIDNFHVYNFPFTAAEIKKKFDELSMDKKI